MVFSRCLFYDWDTPTSGFFSKWYLISGGIQAEQYTFVMALVISSFVECRFILRIIEITYFGSLKEGKGLPKLSYDEAPVSMLIPIIISAVAIIALGLYTSEVVDLFIQPILPEAWQ